MSEKNISENITKINANSPALDIPTPNLDELEKGPWPSYVSGLKRLAASGAHNADMMRGVIGTLEQSFVNRRGYWKGGTVGVIGYGGGVIPRFSELKDDNGETMYPAALEFHTVRIQPPWGNHYSADLLRKMCDVWEDTGTGLIGLHGQSGDIMFQGTDTEGVQSAFNQLNDVDTFKDLGVDGFCFDMGGAGPAVRTSVSCVGAARCEQSCFNEGDLMQSTINEFLDDMHRPALPYKMKWKFSGCPNDCTNAIQRADMAVIGTWRDDIKINQDGWKAFVADKGIKHVFDNVISRCPSQCMEMAEDNSLTIGNKECVKCMHCINVLSSTSQKYVGKDGDAILAQGDDKGITILMGGKRTLKVGDLFGTVIVPFMKMETEEDKEKFLEISGDHVDFFAENALEHERSGEMIERIGLPAYLEAMDLEVDPNMISVPRTSPYDRMDDWDDEVAKWEERKSA
ncbi:MAG: dissimilatory-type sulfite reductase subunit alpha [Thiotrichales bacterium]|nr:dissimilatory-type sulfite reductase subunit alpha [Thiotrichales bacterium]